MFIFRTMLKVGILEGNIRGAGFAVQRLSSAPWIIFQCVDLITASPKSLKENYGVQLACLSSHLNDRDYSCFAEVEDKVITRLQATALSLSSNRFKVRL